MAKIPRPSFQRSFSVIYYETPTRNMFACSKRKKLDWWFQVVKGFNYGQEPNKRNFVAKSGLSRFTRTWWGSRGGGDHNIPQKL